MRYFTPIDRMAGIVLSAAYLPAMVSWFYLSNTRTIFIFVSIFIWLLTVVLHFNLFATLYLGNKQTNLYIKLIAITAVTNFISQFPIIHTKEVGLVLFYWTIYLSWFYTKKVYLNNARMFESLGES
jgi:glucan phosphoethanolaminetransferase (alkaline phosphatase superfamily)